MFTLYKSKEIYIYIYFEWILSFKRAENYKRELRVLRHKKEAPAPTKK